MPESKATIRPWTWDSGEGRIDVDGVEWFACDPYPTWYRWDADTLVTPKDGRGWPCIPTWPESAENGSSPTPETDHE